MQVNEGPESGVMWQFEGVSISALFPNFVWDSKMPVKCQCQCREGPQSIARYCVGVFEGVGGITGVSVQRNWSQFSDTIVWELRASVKSTN